MWRHLGVLLFLPALVHGQPPVTTVDQHIKKLAAEAPLALRFQGAMADECSRWQKHFAHKMREFGPHAPPKQWRTEIRHVKELDDHRREELLLHAEEHPSLPVYVLVPRDTVKGKRLASARWPWMVNSCMNANTKHAITMSATEQHLSSASLREFENGDPV